MSYRTPLNKRTCDGTDPSDYNYCQAPPTHCKLHSTLCVIWTASVSPSVFVHSETSQDVKESPDIEAAGKLPSLSEYHIFSVKCPECRESHVTARIAKRCQRSYEYRVRENELFQQQLMSDLRQRLFYPSKQDMEPNQYGEEASIIEITTLTEDNSVVENKFVTELYTDMEYRRPTISISLPATSTNIPDHIVETSTTDDNTEFNCRVKVYATTTIPSAPVIINQYAATPFMLYVESIHAYKRVITKKRTDGKHFIGIVVRQFSSSNIIAGYLNHQETQPNSFGEQREWYGHKCKRKLLY